MKINLMNDVYGTNQLGIMNIGMPTIMVQLSNTSSEISYKENELAEKIFSVATNKFGIEHGFYHPRTGQSIQLCISGDDPMEKQNVISAIVNELDNIDDYNSYPVLIETAATIPIDFPLKRFIYYTDHVYHFSCEVPLYSKYYSVNTNIIENYADNSSSGSVNLIVDGTEKCWERVDEFTDGLFEVLDVNPSWSLWITPKHNLIAHESGQLMDDIIDETLRRGYNILSHSW